MSEKSLLEQMIPVVKYTKSTPFSRANREWRPPEKPMLDMRQWTEQDLESRSRTIRGSIQTRIMDGIARGYFDFDDIEAIRAAILMMAIEPECDANKVNKMRLMESVLVGLSKTVEGRKKILLAEDAGQRLQNLENAVMDLMNGGGSK